jgi:hypothetical protein
VIKWLSSVARENYFNARDPDLDALAVARPVRSTAVHVRAHTYALIANVSPIKPICVVGHHAMQNAKHYAAYRSKGQRILRL